MCAIKHIVFYWTFLYIINLVLNLEELPPGKENDIIKTEAAIRHITNKLFADMMLNVVKNQDKLKEYSLVHNFFVSLTLRDYQCLKEISRFSRVDKNVINIESETYVVLLNEVLNAQDNSLEGRDNEIISKVFADDIIKYTNNYLHEHSNKHLENIGLFDKRASINKDIITILDETTQEDNVTETDQYELLPANEFWEPLTLARRIYNGRHTKVKHYPFIAAVLVFQQFQCGGSIIKDDLIITAASCIQLAWNNRLYRENPSFLSVRIGSTYYNGGGEEIAILEVYFHPNYNPRNLNHNLGLMRLVRRIKFGKKTDSVKKISLDTSPSDLPFNTPGVVIVGWGSKSQSNIVKDSRLSFDVLDVYPLQDCQDVYSSEYVTRRNFCAGYISKGSGACNRDVGGPGVVGGYLVGVVSFGSPACGTPDAPTVFTKVGYYYDWIEQIMEQHVPHKLSKTTTHASFMEYNLPSQTTNFWFEPLRDTSKAPYVIETTTDLALKAGWHMNFDVDIFQDFLRTIFYSWDVTQNVELFTNENTPKHTTLEQQYFPLMQKSHVTKHPKTRIPKVKKSYFSHMKKHKAARHPKADFIEQKQNENNEKSLTMETAEKAVIEMKNIEPKTDYEYSEKSHSPHMKKNKATRHPKTDFIKQKQNENIEKSLTIETAEKASTEMKNIEPKIDNEYFEKSHSPHMKKNKATRHPKTDLIKQKQNENIEKSLTIETAGKALTEMKNTEPKIDNEYFEKSHSPHMKKNKATRHPKTDLIKQKQNENIEKSLTIETAEKALTEIKNIEPKIDNEYYEKSHSPRMKKHKATRHPKADFIEQKQNENIEMSLTMDPAEKALIEMMNIEPKIDNEYSELQKSTSNYDMELNTNPIKITEVAVGDLTSIEATEDFEKSLRKLPDKANFISIEKDKHQINSKKHAILEPPKHIDDEFVNGDLKTYFDEIRNQVLGDFDIVSSEGDIGDENVQYVEDVTQTTYRNEEVIEDHNIYFKNSNLLNATEKIDDITNTISRNQQESSSEDIHEFTNTSIYRLNISDYMFWMSSRRHNNLLRTFLHKF